MDFSFFDKINIAKTEETETWFKGLDRVYNSFVYDFYIRIRNQCLLLLRTMILTAS